MQQAAALGVAVVLALSDTVSSFQVPPSFHRSCRRHADGASGALRHVSRFETTRTGYRHCTSVKDLARSNGSRRKRNLRSGAGVDSEETELVSRESSLPAFVWNRGNSAAGGSSLAAGVGDGVRVSPLISSQSTTAKTEIPTDVAVVGDPQKVVEKEYSIEVILKELAEIQNQGPKNYCVLGTRHCSFLHQQIIELLAYALVLSGNHVFTSGAMGTNAATIRGALRAERKDLLTVVLPQSLEKQSEASRELIQKVKNVVTNPQNDHLPLDAASRLCNSDLLSRTEQLICFAFHDSKTIIETSKEARSLNMIVTELYLD